MTIEEIKAEMRKKKRNKYGFKQHSKSYNKHFFRYLSKIFIVVIVTLGLLIAIKSNKSFKTTFYKKVYEENINFMKINNLYQKYFGSPIPFSDYINEKTKTVFNEELSYSAKETYLEGVKLTVGNEYLIPVLESGMVVYVGEKEEYGNTVIVQQINGYDVWYSNIGTSSVNIYDYVEKGTLLGEAMDNSLILVFKKDGKAVNYEEMLN